jgi:hypothetical protein
MQAGRAATNNKQPMQRGILRRNRFGNVVE